MHGDAFVECSATETTLFSKKNLNKILHSIIASTNVHEF